MNAHERFDELAAAHVLGALEPGDRREFEDHLRSCEGCRRDVLDLAPIPALLSRLERQEVEDIAQPAPGADAAVAAVRDEITRLARGGRRWRAGAAVASAAALAVLGLAVMRDEPGRSFDGVPLEVAAATVGAEVSVLADERPWGTYVWVSARQLPPRDGYVLWVVDDGGDWERAGTFAPTQGGAADLGGSTHHPLAEIDRVVVTSTDRRDELVTAS